MESNEKKTFRMRWEAISTSPTFPRTIIVVFFILVCILSIVQGLQFPALLSDALVRAAMNAVMVLAMVPSIQSGLGPNFGLPIGILVGLLGALISFQLQFVGWMGLFMSILITLPMAIIVGIIYGMVLNRIKGSELIVSTYIGYAIVSFMSIGWIFLPFSDVRMRWPLGRGLRNVISLDGIYSQILNDQFSLKLVQEKATGKYIVLFNKSKEFILQNYDSEFYKDIFKLPVAMIVLVLLICFLVWLYMRSKSGVMLTVVGENPKFAASNGINVDFYRIVGATLSTVLAAVGIIIYSQSYGYMQLYQGPHMMAFPAVAAVLIGGATAKNAKISHVLVGVFLFQGLLTLALPALNTVFSEGNLSETIRMIVQNGVILFALTQVGGNK